jgi:hypothetical protein
MHEEMVGQLQIKFACKEDKAHNYPNPSSPNGPPSKSYFGRQAKQDVALK